ncbi:MAG: agmatinase [Rickettsiales bacterium]|nr:agmatinase [Rickettsiales bacterium]
MTTNFLGIDKKFSEYKNSKSVILPIPFDKTASWGKGAAEGPQAIIEASQYLELYDIESNSEPYKEGIFTAKPVIANSSKTMIDEGHKKTLSFLQDNKFVITLGGDHSISIGPIFAHQEFFKDISILHFDAHTDMRDSYEDNKLSHACAMARAKERVSNIVSVGIRSMDKSELPYLKKEKLFLASDICCNSNNWIEKIVKQLGEKVYLSFDLDAFDPSIMPATGTPEPGGLGWYQVIQLMEAVCKERKLIGMDIVELAPIANNKAPNFLAAKLIYKILSYKTCA